MHYVVYIPKVILPSFYSKYSFKLMAIFKIFIAFSLLSQYALMGLLQIQRCPLVKGFVQRFTFYLITFLFFLLFKSTVSIENILCLLSTLNLRFLCLLTLAVTVEKWIPFLIMFLFAL